MKKEFSTVKSKPGKKEISGANFHRVDLPHKSRGFHTPIKSEELSLQVELKITPLSHLYEIELLIGIRL